VVVLFRRFLSDENVRRAKAQAEKGIPGSMEGHAEMDMSVTGGSLWSRVRSPKGVTAISHYFVMDWAAVWRDVAGALLIAGALAAWVPKDFWTVLFGANHSTLALLWGPLVGPLVAVVSFVCSVGNVPLAAVLWNSGISFGGVIAFIFADLIVIPVIDIYRRYYTGRIAWFLTWTMYVAMSAAGPRSRIPVQGRRLGADRAPRHHHRGTHLMELHDGVEPGVSRGGSASRLEGGDNRRLHDGAPDEHAVDQGSRRSRHAAAQALTLRLCGRTSSQAASVA
jgi:hypothetical protein